MTHRERVLCSIRFEPVDRIPYHISFTGEMRRKMDRYTGLADYTATLDNHIFSAFLDKPQEEITSFPPRKAFIFCVFIVSPALSETVSIDSSTLL